ncbi:hypothetical protein LEP1GSC125_0971 [Leptospira mayottensis 200901122]|uniref:Uncharacterized protein n=1 Tax=Leptospira mayottensis 200901122 TaxID=1193010 RepID=A0AA87SZ85_9LEPT|nr:hypothetical protein LEP1GSC125_0971 [Leptospira mayottensis 200901122]
MVVNEILIYSLLGFTIRFSFLKFKRVFVLKFKSIKMVPN